MSAFVLISPAFILLRHNAVEVEQRSAVKLDVSKLSRALLQVGTNSSKESTESCPRSEEGGTQ